jgi:hypothetical protein
VLPDLGKRAKLRALGHAAEADNYRGWTLGGSREQRSAALWAERLDHMTPTLHQSVALGLAGELELTNWHGDRGPEGCARHDLAVGAVANRHPTGIYLRGK